MTSQQPKPDSAKYTELFAFYRDGHPVHIHRDRGVFERWMKDQSWQYPPERCEIQRFVPDGAPPAQQAAPRVVGYGTAHDPADQSRDEAARADAQGARSPLPKVALPGRNPAAMTEWILPGAIILLAIAAIYNARSIRRLQDNVHGLMHREMDRERAEEIRASAAWQRKQEGT